MSTVRNEECLFVVLHVLRQPDRMQVPSASSDASTEGLRSKSPHLLTRSSSVDSLDAFAATRSGDSIIDHMKRAMDDLKQHLGQNSEDVCSIAQKLACQVDSQGYAWHCDVFRAQGLTCCRMPMPTVLQMAS